MARNTQSTGPLRNASPKKRMPSEMPEMVRPPDRASAMPRNSIRPPSVATNDGRPKRATQVPFHTPTSTPMPIAAATVTHGLTRWLASSRATTVTQRLMNEPTDRSISPCATTTSMPRATIAVMAVCRMRLVTLRSLTNTPSVRNEKAIQTRATATSNPAAERATEMIELARFGAAAFASGAGAAIAGVFVSAVFDFIAVPVCPFIAVHPRAQAARAGWCLSCRAALPVCRRAAPGSGPRAPAPPIPPSSRRAQRCRLRRPCG
ncbi:hypothetical protein R8871_06666 [Paraburkholderia graminis C4D1M]|nr:hypothetical protein R8871_06666 [Paraburkholderia graminis C4D1M]